MSSNTQLQEMIQSVTDWSLELEEIWTGTTPGEVLEYHRLKLNDAVQKEEWEKAHDLLHELSSVCFRTEKEG